ncbi:thiamine monophosphate kinase [Corynebacterium glutamicum MT]|uniref:Thiamine-monophosphate kinase n=1 Tax=Corynebacterium glutamicum TaxID=1718 RepID=A0AB36I9E2_CORGT|nr:thiamine-phosphate kinase [Corynebacterium glutamicum]AGN19061.1 thiamine monophosphate kinase [Corynebacterium glutamicum SCgG1]AGN22084.1 thiamine monophosphate kinase [Corynebacterium glutamicum SCgG2]EGV39167.1 thiamine monophosphate kinase [Corynebacterium glutamicum S9114]EOA63790.1 thiamine monophosphate kinase [Corynebacterium glutamicum MT]EPP40797.1 thiamine monophosphate kinase [Corynebacterium glutamicum Z188]
MAHSLSFPDSLRDGPTVGDLGEFEVIRVITEQAGSSLNGDDAAVLRHASPNSRAVVTTDMLVAGRHFQLDWSTPEQIGQKAIVQNFADIEAMGARPVAALLAISAPTHTPVEFVRGLARGMNQRLEEYSAELVGGDITSGDSLVISVTAIGQLGGSLPEMTLGRARPGQTLVAHGKIGYSAAGLALLQHFGPDNVPEHLRPLVDAHCAPVLTPGRGMVARAAGATAMTDNSDGLIVDLNQMAMKSGVRIDVDSSSISPDELLSEAASVLGTDAWRWILSGGEDHTLLSTTFGDAPSGFRTIGQVTKTRHEDLVTVDKKTPAFSDGWRSF